MAITAPGLGSNLDVSGIVDKLMQVERRPLTKLDTKEAAVQSKISAYGSLRAAISTFHTAVKGLADGSRYDAARATVASADVASASATDKAAAGSYSLEVTNLARAQRLHTAAFASTTSTVGTGTLTIQYGSYDAGGNSFTANASKPVQSLTIDAAHGSLAGVRDAINAAGLGITASIVNDGTGNRLVIGGKDTGAASSMKITVTDDDGNGTDAAGLSQLAYDPTQAAGSGKNLTQVIAAQDATLLIDGMLITKSSNTVSDAIEGVTLQLTKTNVGSPTTLSVSKDTAQVSAAVNAFVKTWNDLDKTIAELSKIDRTGDRDGPLQNEAALRTVAGQLRLALTASIAGGGGQYTSLSQVGISVERGGTLKLDAAKLEDAIKKDGASVKRLFASAGASTDSLVAFESAADATVPGSYALEVSQLATRATLSGGAAAGLVIDGSNDSLSLAVDGVGATITLTHKTYASAQELAAELQSQINGAAALLSAGVSVTVTESAGVLTVQSARYGSAGGLAINGGSASTPLFGAAPTTTAGLDVAGSLGGGAASGAGQVLTGASAATQGLKVKVLGGAVGARGVVSYGRGLAAALDALLSGLEGSKGAIATRTSSLQKSVTDIGNERTRLSERLARVESRYTQQFSRLDQTVSELQRASSYLAQQLSNLNKSLE